LETVADIGANWGQFVLVARHVFPDARIVSFEPLPDPAAKFLRVFHSDPAVRLHELAIGPEVGEATIHVSGRDDSSSLLPIGVEQNRLFRGIAEVSTQMIHVARLSDLVSVEDLRPPVLLKLDVQGFELSALQGCEELMQRFAWVYCECLFVELYEGQALADEVIAWLRERRFVLTGV
jgi:FkbM family methyltransferase